MQPFYAAGLNWYEVSNWSKTGSPCRHNVAYWQVANWWGAGPGAHSHIDGRRWWNVKHPTAYRERIKNSLAPMQEQEILTPEEKSRETIMLLIRLPGGLKREVLDNAQLACIEGYVASGDIDPKDWDLGLVTLTQQGRLIADRIVRDLVL